MEYTKLGNSDLTSSRIGLGTWAIGGWGWGGTDETRSIKALHRAFNEGINLVDTAPIYGFGVSEEICGKAIQQYGKRDQIIIADKAGVEWGDHGLYWCNTSKQRIITECEDSLRRLQTDYIDLYQLHYPVANLPVETAAEAFAQLLQEGKIRAIGVSNFSIEQIEEWRQIAPIHSSQNRLNVLQSEWLPNFEYCGNHQIGTLTWGTLAQGLLTGKFNETSTFPEDDLRYMYPLFTGEYFPQYLKAVHDLKQLAHSKGKNVAQLAVRWVLDQPGVSVALWGARDEYQLDDISGVMGWSLSAEDMNEIDRILKNSIHDPFVDPSLAPPTKKELQELGYIE